MFVDRDGVLNHSDVRGGKPYAPRSLKDFRLLPGTAKSVSELKAAGFVVVVVTNQPDVGLGHLARDVLAAMHKRLQQRIQVDAIYACLHRQDEGCSCRKPRPGLILQAASEWKIDVQASFMVGDRWSDVAAGQAAGAFTIFIDRGYSETLTVPPRHTVGSLPEAARYILGRPAKGKNPNEVDRKD